MSNYLSSMSKTVDKKKKRLGRGIGSGRGSKSGHGTTRHQNAREKIPLHFEGGQGRMVKKYPLLRGKWKNKSVREVIEIRLRQLNVFEDGADVTMSQLVTSGIVNVKDGKKRVKVILNGKLTKKLNVALPVTEGVKKAIEELGGTVATV
jgi:large subunit ribosomal protein L15